MHACYDNSIPWFLHFQCTFVSLCIVLKEFFSFLQSKSGLANFFIQLLYKMCVVFTVLKQPIKRIHFVSRKIQAIPFPANALSFFDVVLPAHTWTIFKKYTTLNQPHIPYRLNTVKQISYKSLPTFGAFLLANKNFSNACI